MEFFNIINEDYFNLVKSNNFTPLIKVELLDELENAVSELTNELSADSSGSLNCGYQQGVRKTISFSIFDLNGDFIPSINGGKIWVKTKIRLFLGIGDGEKIFWFSKGVFVIKDLNVSKSESGTLISISAVDKFGIFTSDTGFNELQGIYEIPVNQPICSAIEELLNEDCGNGLPIDPIKPIFAPEIINEVAPFSINKGPGTYLGDFLIEIANILGCNIFYDINGRLVFSMGTVDSSYSLMSSIWDFKEGDSEYISTAINYNLSEVTNVVKIVGDNINEKIFISIAENNSPTSSTRVDLIGRKEKYITSSFVYNQERADDYAGYELNRLSIVQSGINFSSTFLPHLELDKIFTLTDSQLKCDRKRYVIKSIGFAFSDGITTISGSDLADLPYYDLREGN